MVLREGDSVRASGRVVAIGGIAWFEPSLPVPLVFYPPGHEPPPRPSGLGVQAIGVDLVKLDDRRERQGAVEGWATLTGDWRQDRLVVGEQGPQSPAQYENPSWTRPPCPAPTGGWPEGVVDENFHLPPELYTSHVITSITTFRPSRTQTVLVVAAEEPQQVRATLRPRYGARLCVVPSRWTRRQIDDVTRRVRAEMLRWMIYSCGQSTTEDGQALVTVDLSRVLPAFAEWASTISEGLLSLNPWLTPRPTPRR